MSIADLPEVTAPSVPPSGPGPQPPAPQPQADELRKWPVEATVTAWVVIAAGAAFRLRWFFHWRSFWLDELYLAHSIITRGFHRLLFEPLDFWQGAPAGFLILERICFDLFGPGERALRIPSLLAGLAALPLFYLLARRALTARAALLAIVLFAALRPMIYYSAELKQYSTDVTVTLGLLLCAANAWRTPTMRNWIVLCAVGAAAIFFSHPAILVLIALTLVLLGARPRQSVIPLLLSALVWAGLEYANIHFFLGSLVRGQTHDGLVRQWTALGGFPPYEPNLAAAWIWSAIHNLLAGYWTMYLNAAPLAMFAAMLGLGALMLSRRRALGLLIFLPLVVAIVAAFRHKYPLADRLALYLVPMLVLLIAAGVDQIWGAAGQGGWTRAAAGGLAALMIIVEPVHRAMHEFHFPGGREETKQIYQWVRDKWRTGDVVLLSHMAALSFDHYAPQTGLAGLEQLWPMPESDQDPPLEASAQGMKLQPGLAAAFVPRGKSVPPVTGYVVLQPDRTGNPGGYLNDIDAVFHPSPDWHWPPIKRVWVVFAHAADETGQNVKSLCLAELDRCAQQMVRHSEDGEEREEVYLYELTGTATADQRQ